MQIVRDLAGYTYGGSDVLRRAMSKKKAKVMEEERQNFVYGNKEKNIPGCIRNGISEAVANKIYDDMIDFAKYAFNKSHAAAYAIVSFQTAWLKYYFPVEFMAALMTSVIDNPGKCAEYILHCRQMKIEILPPDINKSRGSFSVEDGKIRYALTAVKGIGKPVMDAIEKERERGGAFRSLQDFCQRLSGKEVNKRTLESFIKAGAFDSLGGTRKQYLQVYSLVMDQAAEEKKSSMTGQLSLFDFMTEKDRKSLEIRLPDVGEFGREEKLAFEKEVTGIYITGHPLQDYEGKWKKHITAVTADFQPDEETGQPRIQDDSHVTVGGMITEKTIKYTKTNQTMAFVTLEDLLGTVEIIVFPKSFEKYSDLLQEDAKVFISGRVSGEEDKASKLILEKLVPFSEVPTQVWLQLEDRQEYQEKIQEIRDTAAAHPGRDQLVLYLKKERAVKRTQTRVNAGVRGGALDDFNRILGAENVKAV